MRHGHRLHAAAIALAILMPGVAAATCIARAPRYSRARDLPKGASEALGFTISDAGQPFRAGDVVLDPSLPFRRFVGATQVGCRLTIEFERGGRGLSVDTIALVFVDGRWIKSTHQDRR